MSLPLTTPLLDTLAYRLDTTSNSCMIAAEVLLLVLTWIKTYQIKKASYALNLRTPIATLLLRDGTLYFVVILAIQVFAIISIDSGSTFVLFDVWTYFRQVFVVIFTSHFMLNLRGVSMSLDEQEFETSYTGNSTDVRFMRSIVGNLGAPIDIRRTMSPADLQEEMLDPDKIPEDPGGTDGRNSTGRAEDTLCETIV
ncbi:hypothetical protein CERSUDRAFT_96770 [Gelatoporia subvermispora B]|uniref:Uncharacterized protein n=1 Tax=Ceriporiopsis subvermispora (strain B) TaxID=914234 RepID=M2QU96_CERS8|nr:hypothetical protein CERSUDRAFT_96770 [Gelatoporia subvermispora B]